MINFRWLATCTHCVPIFHFAKTNDVFAHYSILLRFVNMQYNFSIIPQFRELVAVITVKQSLKGKNTNFVEYEPDVFNNSIFQSLFWLIQSLVWVSVKISVVKFHTVLDLYCRVYSSAKLKIKK
jgi:hypothetical protein